jgi:hypothetical protein
VLWDLDAQSINALFGEALNTNRATIGLPPVDHVRDYVYGDQPWLAAIEVLARVRAPARLAVAEQHHRVHLGLLLPGRTVSPIMENGNGSVGELHEWWSSTGRAGGHRVGERRPRRPADVQRSGDAVPEPL